MGYDSWEHRKDCNICGTNYIYHISYDHDSFNYSYSTDYDCPTCGKGLYVKKNKDCLDKLNARLDDLVSKGESYFTDLIISEYKLKDRVHCILESMPSKIIAKSFFGIVVERHSDESFKKADERPYYYFLLSDYKTKLGFKKDTVYNLLKEEGLYTNTITRFKKEYKGICGIDILLSFYNLTYKEYRDYILLNTREGYKTVPYITQYTELKKEIKKAKKEYEDSINIYNKYYKK